MVDLMSEVTRILSAIEQGDPHAAEQLLPLVYEELRKLAAQKLAQEKQGQTLQATALVHEAYLRLVASGAASAPRETPWTSRGHFFAAAAEAMRRILVEQARRKRRTKHGGGRVRVDLDRVSAIAGDVTEDIVALDEALQRLAVEESAAAEVVKLRYFAGLTAQDTAAAMGISLRTANRHWAYAKAWLYQQLHSGCDERA
jgi:RNA polymerase sigma factor (TIGR02999 family)